MTTWLAPVILFILLCCTVACRSTESYVAKGKALAAAGKTEDAVLNFRKAIQKDGSYGPAYLALAELSLQDREHSMEGYRLLKQAVTLMPDNVEARVKLAEFSLAAYAASSRPQPSFYEQVQKTADELLARDSNSFDGLRLRGAVAMLDRKPAIAVSYFTKANVIRPWNDSVVLELVQAYIANSDTEKGEKLGIEALQRNKDFLAMYDLLYAHYMAARQPRRAEELLQLEVRNLPDNSRPVFALAAHYARVGQMAQIEEVLRPLLMNKKAFPNAAIEVADFYTRVAEPELALQHIERGLREAPQSQHLLYKRAMANALLSLKRYAEAREVVDAMLKENPSDVSAQAFRASLLVQSRKPSDVNAAVEQLRALSSRSPQNVEILTQLGQALVFQRGYDEAATAYTKALKLSNTPALRLALAQVRLEQRQPTTALQLSGEILERQPQNVPAHLIHAAATAAAGNLEQARSELSKLPPGPAADLQLAVVAVAQKRYKEAQKLLEGVLSREPGNGKAAQWLADCRWAQGDIDGAVAVLTTFLKDHPGEIEMRLQLASKAVAAGRSNIAVEQLTGVVERDASWADGHFHLGQVLSATGDKANAEKHLRKATELAPKTALLWMGLADLHRAAGHMKDAEIALRRAVELEPANAQAKNNLAYMVMENGGRLDEAVKFAQDAVQIDRRQPAFADTLGYLYLKKGDLASAHEVFAGLAKANPTNASVQFHYGEVLMQKGDREAAKVVLTAALANKPDPKDESRIRQLLAIR